MFAQIKKVFTNLFSSCKHLQGGMNLFGVRKHLLAGSACRTGLATTILMARRPPPLEQSLLYRI